MEMLYDFQYCNSLAATPVGALEALTATHVADEVH